VVYVEYSRRWRVAGRWFIGHLSHPSVPFRWDIVGVIIPHLLGAPISRNPPPISAQSIIIVLKIPISILILSNQTTAPKFGHSSAVRQNSAELGKMAWAPCIIVWQSVFKPVEDLSEAGLTLGGALVARVFENFREVSRSLHVFGD